MSNYFDVPLFEVEQQQRITPDHIEAIWQLAYLPNGSEADEDAKNKALLLANKDIDQAVNFLADYSGIALASGWMTNHQEKLESLRASLRKSLINPDELPALVTVPTFEDCHRLADTSTESGRAIAWLLGTWPDSPAYSPIPTPLGKVDDELDSHWCYLTENGISVHKRIDKHPWAKKIVYRFTNEATRSQLVGAARWLLNRAGDPR